MRKGQVVKSLSGHDGGIYHVTVDVEGRYAYIVDGRRRKTDRPKKKSVKHLLAVDEFMSLDSLTNKRIRNVLHKYNYSGDKTEQKSPEEE